RRDLRVGHGAEQRVLLGREPPTVRERPGPALVRLTHLPARLVAGLLPQVRTAQRLTGVGVLHLAPALGRPLLQNLWRVGARGGLRPVLVEPPGHPARLPG